MTSVRGLTRYWWLLWLASIVLTAGAVASFVAVIVIPGALTSAGGIDVYVISFLILAPVYASVGAVIVSRGAGNRVGWFISAIGLCIALQDFAGDYSALVAMPQGRSLPAGVWMNWVGNWIWVPAILGALALLPIYFPDGHLP